MALHDSGRTVPHNNSEMAACNNGDMMAAHNNNGMVPRDNNNMAAHSDDRTAVHNNDGTAMHDNSSTASPCNSEAAPCDEVQALTKDELKDWIKNHDIDISGQKLRTKEGTYMIQAYNTSLTVWPQILDLISFILDACMATQKPSKQAVRDIITAVSFVWWCSPGRQQTNILLF